MKISGFTNGNKTSFLNRCWNMAQEEEMWPPGNKETKSMYFWRRRNTSYITQFITKIKEVTHPFWVTYGITHDNVASVGVQPQIREFNEVFEPTNIMIY